MRGCGARPRRLPACARPSPPPSRPPAPPAPEGRYGGGQVSGEKVLMHERVRVGASLSAWTAGGGGAGLRNALAQPEAVIDMVEAADLRGMGGAGFPTHRKWAMLAAHHDCDKFVICNGNEDEPGTFKDRFLLEHTPHQVIEGALIAAMGVRACHVVLYINPHEERAIAVNREAVLQWQAHELFATMERAIG